MHLWQRPVHCCLSRPPKARPPPNSRRIPHGNRVVSCQPSRRAGAGAGCAKVGCAVPSTMRSAAGTCVPSVAASVVVVSVPFVEPFVSVGVPFVVASVPAVVSCMPFVVARVPSVMSCVPFVVARVTSVVSCVLSGDANAGGVLRGAWGTTCLTGIGCAGDGSGGGDDEHRQSGDHGDAGVGQPGQPVVDYWGGMSRPARLGRRRWR